MKFVYLNVALIIFFSGYACASDVSHIMVGAGHTYSGKPDSEEKMVIAAIIKKPNFAGLLKLRADSPYPKRIDVLHPEPQKSLRIFVKDSKDSAISSIGSCGSISTISLETPTVISTPGLLTEMLG